MIIRSVCQPSFTYSRKEISLKFDTTSDMAADTILWSVNSTDTDGSTAHAFPVSGHRVFYLDLKYEHPDSGEHTEGMRMYIVGNDEVFLK